MLYATQRKPAVRLKIKVLVINTQILWQWGGFISVTKFDGCKMGKKGMKMSVFSFFPLFSMPWLLHLVLHAWTGGSLECEWCFNDCCPQRGTKVCSPAKNPPTDRSFTRSKGLDPTENTRPPILTQPSGRFTSHTNNKAPWYCHTFLIMEILLYSFRHFGSWKYEYQVSQYYTR